MEYEKSVPGSVHAEEVRRQLDRILADSAFSGANRRSRLLRYLVERALEDSPESLKESLIASEVFDRKSNYDPQIDSVVRVEVGRLRSALAEFYARTGAGEPVLIEIPKGGYRPVFTSRTMQSPVESGGGQARARSSRWPSRWPSRWAWIATALVAMAAILLVWRLRNPTPAPVTPAAIAVLPFLNLTGNNADEYLGEGISEELTESLAEFDDLRVVARTSAFKYQNKSADVREIGRDLHAGAVLEGSVARRGTQLRVIAQLIRTADGYHLWSHSYDAGAADIPSVEDAIARSCRQRLALPSRAAAARPSPLRNPEAHDLYMRAVYELNRRTEASTRLAMELAQQAVEKDATFAQPYVVMAAGETQLTTLLAQPPHPAAQRALDDIAKALALDPVNSAAHAHKAIVTYTDQWDWLQAEREFRLAISSGSHSAAESLYGWCPMTRGRFEEARRHLQLAAELDPLSLGPQLNQVEESLAERNYREARSRLERILQVAPTNPVALALATFTANWQNDCPAAAAWGRRLNEAGRGSMIGALGAMYAGGRCTPPKENAGKFLQEHSSGYISPYAIAGAYAAGSRADPAIAYLLKAAEYREPALLMLKVDHVFDPIRGDQRVIALERQLGLEN